VAEIERRLQPCLDRWDGAPVSDDLLVFIGHARYFLHELNKLTEWQLDHGDGEFLRGRIC
jgi:hypothetical protein